MGIDRRGRGGGSGDRQEWGGGGECGDIHGEWGWRGSVDRHDWEGRRRPGIDRRSGVGGGESGDRVEEWGWRWREWG